MAGIGKGYTVGEKFELKSGNKPSFFQMGNSPAKQKNIGEELKKKYKGTKQTTDVEGKKIHGDLKYYEHKYETNPVRGSRGKLKKGYPKWIYPTQEERSEMVNE